MSLTASKKLHCIILFLLSIALWTSSVRADDDYQSFPHLIPEINTFTGAASHNIPITVPPGRNAVQPDLAFTYSSYRQNSMIAKGWQLPIALIQRRTKRGVHYDQNEFDLHGKNGKVELVEISGRSGYYRTRIETNFSQYRYDSGGDYWEVTHRDGTKYYFGYSPANGTSGDSRQTNAHGTFKWCLAQVQDPNGNYMNFEYFQDQGQVYPSRIDYTGNSNTSLSPTSSVVFDYEIGDRPDTRISYESMSLVTTAKRLESVKTYALLPGSGNTMALEYRLEYDQSPASQTSLLSKIRIIGTDGNMELPGYTFSYSQGSIGTLVQGQTTTDINVKDIRAIFADIDGDNRDDLVIAGHAYSCDGNGTFTQLENSEIPVPTDSDSTIYSADLNGDGNADLIQHVYKDHTDSQGNTTIQKHNLSTYISNGNGSFTQGTPEPVELEKGEPGHPGNSPYTALLDYNRDGYVDIYTGRKIFASDGDGNLASPVSFTPQGGYVADINGDGLTDSIGIGNHYHTDNYYIQARLAMGNGQFESDAHITDIPNFFPTALYSDDYIINKWFGDLNNDNMADLVIIGANDSFQNRKIWIFLSDGQGGFAYLDGHETDTIGDRMADLNGDGYPDFATPNYQEEVVGPGGIIISPERNEISTVLSQNTAPFDLLTQAVSPSGATLTYTYRRSNEITNHHHLPFIVYPVASLELDDGVRSDHPRSTFRDELGFYDPSEREFRGFEEATQTHPDNTVTKTFHFVGPPAGFVSKSDSTFHADDNYYYKGRVRQVDKYAQLGGDLLIRTVMTWDKTEHATDPWAFVRLTYKQTAFLNNPTVLINEGYLYDVFFDGLSDDSAGLLRQKTNSGSGAGAVITTYAYHNYNSTWNPMWRKTEEKVYDSGQPDSVARHTQFVYNSTTGNLERKIGVNTDPDVADSVWRYEYDGSGNLTAEYDANGNPPTEYLGYDATQTYPTRIRNEVTKADGRQVILETTKAWDTRWGREDWVTDPNGQTTDYAYDAFGRLTRTDFPDDGYTDLGYSDYCTDPDCTNVSLPRRLKVAVRTVGRETEYTRNYFDGLARKVQSAKTGEDGKFIITKTHYDNMGRIEFESGPFFQASHGFLVWNDYSADGYDTYPGADYPYVYTVYDKRGRPVSKTSPAEYDLGFDLAVTSYAYSGFDTTIIDPDGCVKTEKRDHLDRIREVVEDPAGEDIHTHYSYNAAGDLLTVYNAAEPTASLTRIEYDTLGRKVEMDDPDMGQWTYAYYPNGELELQTDAKGNRIQYFYDDLNRLETKDYLDTDEPTVAYTYDSDTTDLGLGRLSSITNGHVTTAITAYDQVGRKAEMQKTISGAATRTMSWDYDYAGRVQRLTYPHTGASPLFYIDYAFHPRTGLLHTATGPDGTVYATMTGYQPSGKIGTLDFGNNVRTTYGYDGWSKRLTSIYTARDQGAGKEHQDRQYYYSKAGDIEQIDDRVWVETYNYGYDKLHRLKSETTSTGSLGVIPGIYDMQYNDPGHIHAVSSVATKSEIHAYTYDSNGNMLVGPDLTDVQSAVQRSLTFNADNMPTSVTHPTGGTVTITYDGQAKRAKKSGPKGATYYYSNEFELIGGTETCYVFAGNLRVAMVKDYADVTYFHKDHLGSSSVVTDANGEAHEQTRYMPFGGKRGEGTGITASSYLFTDQELDAESGLYNYDARLYDPIVGRFASADSVVPMEFQSSSFDRYAYCMNNPLIYVDPSGYHNQEYGPNMGGFGGLGIGNPGSYGGEQTVGEIGLTDENITDQDSNPDFATGFNYGYWSGVLDETENDRFIYQDIIDPYGHRYLKITPKTPKRQMKPIEELNEKYIKSFVEIKDEKLKAELAKSYLGVIGGFMGIGFLAAAPEVAVGVALSPNCANDFVGNMAPGPPSSFSPCGICGSVAGSIIDDLTK